MAFGTTAARFLTNSPLRTAAIGAGIGAAASGLQQPAEGQTRGRAMFGGALRGAAVGGAAGALGRGYRDTRLLDPSLSAVGAIGGTAKRMGEGVARFGKRQVHGLTGAFDHDAIGMAGNARAAEKTKLLRLRMDDEIKHAPAARAGDLRKSFQGEIDSTLQEGRASQALADAGITTVPGIAKALASGKTRGQAFRAMGKTITDGPGGAVMSLGIPIATSAPSLLRGDESEQGGLSMKRKLIGLGANVGTGMAFGGLPLIPQMATGMGVDYALSKIPTRRNITAYDPPGLQAPGRPPVPGVRP